MLAICNSNSNNNVSVRKGSIIGRRLSLSSILLLLLVLTAVVALTSLDGAEAYRGGRD
jgi:hypothetical protein